ncbi:MAG: NADH-quinone oxidoreductase subunit C, partial [Dehalococcoidia bacterium]|nr:NADH-quinone oxidoreductase subunit C [Dehalococcoidia bacterium]
MTVRYLEGQQLAERLVDGAQGSVEEWAGGSVWVKPSSVEDVARFLRDDPELDFQFLNSISAVDYIEHFEV